MAKVFVTIGSIHVDPNDDVRILYRALISGPPHYQYTGDLKLDLTESLVKNIATWKRKVIEADVEHEHSIHPGDVIIFGAPIVDSPEAMRCCAHGMTSVDRSGLWNHLKEVAASKPEVQNTCEPFISEPVEPEPVEPDPVEPDPAVIEPVEPDPAVIEPVESEPAVIEPVEPEPAVREPVEPELVVIEPVEPEPVESESISDSVMIQTFVQDYSINTVVEDEPVITKEETVDQIEQKVAHVVEEVKAAPVVVEQLAEKPVEEVKHWWQKVAQWFRNVWRALSGK